MIDLSVNGGTGFLKLKRNDKNSGGMKYLAERGADMTQVALYAIAALIVVVLAFTLYSQFTSTNKVKEHITSIKMLNSGLESLFSRQGLHNYSSVLGNESNLVKTNAVPESLKNGAAITNEWGGDIILLPVTGNSFTITDPNIPDKECVDIVLGSYTNFTNVLAGTVLLTRASGPTAAADAVAGCVGGATTIVFTH